MSELGPGPGENNTNNTSESSAAAEDVASVDHRDKATNQWAMFIHFSMLAGWVIPLAGLVVPILLWQLKKDDLPGIVPHAHIVLNWIITSFVYGLICLILSVIVIGAFGFVLLGIVTVIYAILGGIKANNGEIWEYPGTIIKLFK